MRIVPLAAVFAMSLGSPLLAYDLSKSYVASNGLRVYATGPNQFTVPYQNADHATDYLCAAGDYVQLGLGMTNRTRIYRESPQPRKPGKGITFTLDRAKAVPLGIVTSFGGNGDEGISAGAASGNYCYTLRFFPD